LRAAIEQANADPKNGADTIRFSIGSGAQTIVLQSALPAITHQVIINGQTQPGYVNAPLIVLSGSALSGTANGLDIETSNCKVQGLVIEGFAGDGILIGSGSTNRVIGDYIGTDPTGTVAQGNGTGVAVQGTATGTAIGGPGSGEGNLISGNFTDNVLLGPGTSGTQVQGNKIGTDVTGTTSVTGFFTFFAANGVEVSGSTNNSIGGTASGEGNLISGNGGSGVLIDSGSSGTVIQGNKIGTDVTGTQAVGNGLAFFAFSNVDGIDIFDSNNNVVGGTTPGARNLISGGAAIKLFASGVVIQSGNYNTVQGNYIGTDVTGTTALGGTQSFGVQVLGTGNQVGGTARGAGNLVSGNSEGMEIDGTDNTVQGNLIGTDVTGTAVIGNSDSGVRFLNGSGNLLGGTTASARNVISGNLTGVLMYGSSSGNTAEGNYIGTDFTGTNALGNGTGVLIQNGSQNNQVGGTQTGAGNLISGNGTGVEIGNTTPGFLTTGNVVEGNRIGTDVSGASPLGNTGDGVQVLASDNLIGGTAAGAGNTIAFNGHDGVSVNGGTGDAILHNAIFSNANLGIELLNNGNNNQPAPTLTSAQSGGGVVTIQGTFSGQPLTTYTLEFFANPTASLSGFGQGEDFLFSVTVTTDMNGNANFTLSGAAVVPVGWFVTATATDPGNNTSEFSNDVVVTSL
jgi:titin